jgi:uncharacterized protein YndB with AHSA1/START domain
VDTIERHVTLPLDVDEAWRLVSDPNELATWIGTEVDLELEPGASGEVVDPDGTRRQLVIDTVDAGRSISWYWWSDDVVDGGVVSRVQILVTPDGDGSRVEVLEHLSTTLPRAHATAVVSSRHGAWSYRLFSLEVRCLAVSTAALVRA